MTLWFVADINGFSILIMVLSRQHEVECKRKEPTATRDGKMLLISIDDVCSRNII